MDSSIIPAHEAIDLGLAEAQSDYGSDIDAEVLQELLIELEGVSVEPLLLETLEEHESQQTAVHIPIFSSQGSTRTESTQYHSALEEQLLPSSPNRRTSIPEFSKRCSSGETSWAFCTFDIERGLCLTDMLTALSGPECSLNSR